MKCCTTKKTKEDFKRQARIHKALANEARLLIVDRLKDCECSVGELAGAVELDISTVSNHLSVLLAAGIVDNRKEGTTVYYCLLTPCVLDMFACTEDVLKGGNEG
jgi:ArsR family transcriptional regulator